MHFYRRGGAEMLFAKIRAAGTNILASKCILSTGVGFKITG